MIIASFGRLDFLQIIPITTWVIFGFLASNLKIYQYIKMCGVRINNYKRFTTFLGRIIIDMLLFKNTD